MTKEHTHTYKELHISEITAIHYYDPTDDFYFPCKSDDIWEFQYIEKGEALICVNDVEHTLKKGQIIFHKPGEMHSLTITTGQESHVITISFECHSAVIHFFENKLFDITKMEHNLLIMLLCEARKCIASPLNDPSISRMEKYNDDFFGSRQLLYLYLEEFLLYIIRRCIAQPYISPLSNTNSDSVLYNKVLRYLETHICEPITIDDICQNNLISRSQLHKIFQREHHCGVTRFISNMKIEFAKQLIRDSQLNLTQISNYLGYSSIHYFSRQFKKITGVTPSSYTAIYRKQTKL